MQFISDHTFSPIILMSRKGAIVKAAMMQYISLDSLVLTSAFITARGSVVLRFCNSSSVAVVVELGSVVELGLVVELGSVVELDLVVDFFPVLIKTTLYSATGTLIAMINQRKMIAINKNIRCSMSSAELSRMWRSVWLK